MNTHTIKIEDWKYEYVNGVDNPNVFLKDSTKSKYSTMDIIEFVNKEDGKFHSRLVKAIKIRDEGMKSGYVLVTMARKANFGGCIISAVSESLG